MKTAVFIATILSLVPLAGVRGDENGAKGPVLRSPHPPYPAQAILDNIQGSVTFKLTVKNGRIANVSATGPDQLATPCAQWIKEHWQFKKGMTGLYTVSLSFKLPDKSSGVSPTSSASPAPSESPDSAVSPTPSASPVPAESPAGSSAD